ncbi:MAG: hypothetical protein ACUVRA_09385 [Candidatus Bathyarchaeaceae archaeon]
MGSFIRYNILKDGDKVLKGKIAEMIFQRIAEACFLNDLLICRTSELQSLFRHFYFIQRYYSDIIDKRVESLEKVLMEMRQGRYVVHDALADAEEKLKNLKEKVMEITRLLGLNSPEIYESPRCLTCGKDVREPCLQPTRMLINSYVLCRQCAQKIRNDNFLTNELIRNLNELSRIQGLYGELYNLSRYENCMKILSLLSENDIKFLKETLRQLSRRSDL